MNQLALLDFGRTTGAIKGLLYTWPLGAAVQCSTGKPFEPGIFLSKDFADSTKPVCLQSKQLTSENGETQTIPIHSKLVEPLRLRIAESER